MTPETLNRQNLKWTELKLFFSYLSQTVLEGLYQMKAVNANLYILVYIYKVRASSVSTHSRRIKWWGQGAGVLADSCVFYSSFQAKVGATGYGRYGLL